jgi:hypothetical protein
MMAVDDSRNTLSDASAVGNALIERSAENPSNTVPLFDAEFFIGKPDHGYPR